MNDLTEYWGDVDVDSVEAWRGVGEPLPIGEYVLHLDSAEMKITKDGTGIYLACRFKVVEGEHEGRMVFENFNTRNKNAQSQQIGLSKFKALCLATGVPFDVAKSDTTTLLHVPFRARVGFEKPSYEGAERRNEIKKYYPAGGGAPTSAPAAAAPTRPSPVAKPAAAKLAGGGLPWKKPA